MKLSKRQQRIKQRKLLQKELEVILKDEMKKKYGSTINKIIIAKSE
jgi:hypothetical protein